MRPTVTFSPVKPQNEAGRRTDPPESVPIAQGGERAPNPNPGATARPARRARRREVPRIPRRAEMLIRSPAAKCKLDGVGLAEHDHALRDHPPRDGGGHRRAPPAMHCGAAHRDPTFELDEVLQ